MLQTEQGEVGWANVWKTQGGAAPSITNIYSLGYAVFKTLTCLFTRKRAILNFMVKGS